MAETGKLRDDPLWFKDAVFYEIYVRGFYDSNGDGVGDFRGLTEKLDYLEWLGVDCLWLLPMYASPLRDGGYDIADYYSILPEYGTLEDFREFYPIDVLALYAEVYDRHWTDVPHTVDVTTRLVDEQGKEVTRTADARKSSEFQSASTKSGFFGYTTQVPLADVKPGRYMLQVEARPRLKDAPAVRREMLITVVQPPPDLVRPAAKPGAGGGDGR